MKKRKIGIGVSNGSIDPVLPPLMLVVETNGSWIQTILAFDLTNRSTFLSFAPPLFLFSLLFFFYNTHDTRTYKNARSTSTRGCTRDVHTYAYTYVSVSRLSRRPLCDLRSPRRFCLFPSAGVKFIVVSEVTNFPGGSWKDRGPPGRPCARFIEHRNRRASPAPVGKTKSPISRLN